MPTPEHGCAVKFMDYHTTKFALNFASGSIGVTGTPQLFSFGNSARLGVKYSARGVQKVQLHRASYFWFDFALF